MNCDKYTTEIMQQPNWRFVASVILPTKWPKTYANLSLSRTNTSLKISIKIRILTSYTQNYTLCSLSVHEGVQLKFDRTTQHRWTSFRFIHASWSDYSSTMLKKYLKHSVRRGFDSGLFIESTTMDCLCYYGKYRLTKFQQYNISTYSYRVHIKYFRTFYWIWSHNTIIRLNLVHCTVYHFIPIVKHVFVTMKFEK